MDYEKRKHFIVNLLYCGIIILLVTVLIRHGLGLIAPFLAAFIISYFIRIPARWISGKTNIPYKPVALILVVLLFCMAGVLISLLGIELVTSAVNMIAALPKIYSTEIEPDMFSFFDEIEQFVYQLDAALVTVLNDIFTEFVQSIGKLITNLSVEAVGTLSNYASSLPGLFIKILLMIISTFFITGDYDLLVGFVSRQLPEKARGMVYQVKEYVIGTLFVCIRSYALIMSITFVELSIGLSILGVEGAILIALAISIFDILPVLGTGGVLIPWAIVSLIQGDYGRTIGLLVVYLVITVIRNILEPKIVGSQIGLHPIVTLMSMFIGVQLFGVVGLFGFPIFLSLLRHLNDNGTIKLFK